MMISFETLEFYRGLSKKYSTEHPTVHLTRKNRSPRDLPDYLHEVADEWFLEKFGVRYRSQSVFVSSNINVVAAYASSPDHIARIIPLGDYTFCWSSQLTDLLQICMRRPLKDELISDLNDAQYRVDDLECAHRMGHEVMLFCDSYICLPVGTVAHQHD